MVVKYEEDYPEEGEPHGDEDIPNLMGQPITQGVPPVAGRSYDTIHILLLWTRAAECIRSGQVCRQKPLVALFITSCKTYISCFGHSERWMRFHYRDQDQYEGCY